MDFSFKRQSHLKSTSDFTNVYQNGNKKSGLFYTAFFISNNLATSRLGISISKHHGNAVFRNRQKRIIREMFRHEHPHLSHNFDIIITVNNRPRKNQHSQQKNELQRIFDCLKKYSISCEK